MVRGGPDWKTACIFRGSRTSRDHRVLAEMSSSQWEGECAAGKGTGLSSGDLALILALPVGFSCGSLYLCPYL